jgi:hypothetical protein
MNKDLVQVDKADLESLIDYNFNSEEKDCRRLCNPTNTQYIKLTPN